MTAEKDIVNLWLNKKGFFTINNIKENNRDIGILALKIDKGHISKIWHVQVSCSVTGTTKDIEKNFNDKAVARKINEILTNSIGDKTDYVKIVVLSAKPPKAMEGINHLLFDDILYDVFSELDTQYYNDPNIRGMQLVKHLLLSNPRILAKLVSKSGLLSSFGKDEFIRSVMTNDKSKRFVMKLEASAVSDILRNYKFKKPELLAKMVEEDMLNRNTRKQFIDAMLDQKRVKTIVLKRNAKKEKSLKTFFS